MSETKERKRPRKPAGKPTAKRVRRKVAPAAEETAQDGPDPGPNSAGITTTTRKTTVSYVSEIKDMMYTFGDARNSNDEAVALVESIVLTYLSDLIAQATRQAHKRGVTRMILNDIVYQIRKDTPKLNRLKDFLAWKEVRKHFGKSDSPQDKEKSEVLLEPPRRKNRKDLQVGFDVIQSLKYVDSDEEDDSGSEDSSDDLDAFNKERLKLADEMTRTMTREEYMEYTECRQASFTYKKNKKFRQWLGTVMNVQLNEDMVEVLGYLAWEMVGQVTRQALVVKKQMAASMYRGLARSGSIINIKLQPHTYEKDGDKTPLLPLHIREAMRRAAPAQCHSLVDFSFVAHHT